MSPEDFPGSMAAGTGFEGPIIAAELTSENDAAETPAEPVEETDLLTGMPEVMGMAAGQIGRGQIVKIADAEVIVDIGLKSEGVIPRSEFVNEDGQLTVQAGDVVDFLIEEYDEQEGTFTVSHRKAATIRAWESLEKASQENGHVKGRVLERSKGGLTVSIGGVRAFLPASQADTRPLRNLDSLIGQEIECTVIKLNRARNNAVVSRKAALEEELKQRKAELAERLVEGAEITGRVKNLTSYGAFIDLGGMDGLLHVTDLAWGRVGHPSDVVQVGQEIRVKVLKYDPEKERISLGIKQLMPDPWEQVVKTYHSGDRLKGRVVSLTDYGAFCEIEPGIEGLIHVSEMTWSRRLKHPSKFLKVGDLVDVAVLDVNSEQRRISLSLRQSLGDPWSTVEERIAAGAVIEGRVRNLTDYGAFVEIEDGVEGLVHISDLAWTRNVKHPSEVLKKGQKIRAQVLSVDPKQRRISLGLKQLEPDAWQTFFDQTPVGTVLQGKVVRLAQFGAFVELREGIEGLCHVSEMGDEHGRGGKSPLKAEMELPFRVIKINREERKVGLSLKDAEERSEEAEEVRAAPAAGPEPAAPASTTMGEKMAQAIRAAAAASAARQAAQNPAKGPAPGRTAVASPAVPPTVEAASGAPEAASAAESDGNGASAAVGNGRTEPDTLAHQVTADLDPVLVSVDREATSESPADTVTPTDALATSATTDDETPDKAEVAKAES